MTDQASSAPPLTLRGVTFDAFRKRGRSGVLTGAAIFFLLLIFVSTGLFLALAWRGFLDYVNWIGEVASSPSAASTPMMPPASAMNFSNLSLLYQVAYFIILAAFEAAVLRWLTRGEMRGFFGLSLTASDTWLVWASYWVWFGLFIVLYLAEIVVWLVAVAIVAVAKIDATIAGPLALFGVLANVCAILWAAVRFAPAAATSVALQRFAFFDAWKVTQGRFWSLFGSFLLIIVIYLIGATVVVALAGIPLAAPLQTLVSGAIATGVAPQPQEIFNLALSPAGLTAIGLMAALGAVCETIFRIAFCGVNARAALMAKEEGRIS
jgi:hypothetical protein